MTLTSFKGVTRLIDIIAGVTLTSFKGVTRLIDIIAGVTLTRFKGVTRLIDIIVADCRGDIDKFQGGYTTY